MFLLRFGVDQDIVEVSCTGLIQKVVKEVVDIVLERGRGVAESEQHDQRFKESEARDEGRFPFVSFGDSEFIESCYDIQFGVHLRSA